VEYAREVVTPTPETPARGPSRPPWVAPLVFGCAYLLLGEAAERLVNPESQFATFWPPAGLFLAVLLLSERRRWPWFVLVAVVADAAVSWHVERHPALGAAQSLGNVVETLLAARLLQAIAGGRPRMDRVRDVVALLLLGAGLAPAVGGIVGAAGGSLFRGYPFLREWLDWWAGDALGVLIVASFALAWTQGTGVGSRLLRRRPLEFLGLLASTAAVTAVVFSGSVHVVLTDEYLLLPFFLWATLRFGVLGVTTSGVLVGAVAAGVTSWAMGHAGPGALAPDARAVQLLLAFVIGTNLVLAAAISEQRRSQRALRLARFALDHGAEGFLVAGRDGRVVLASEGAARMLGLPRPSLQGRPIGDLDPALAGEAWERRWDEARQQGSLLLDTTLDAGGGRRLHAEVGLSYLSFDGGEYVAWSARDASQRKRAETSERLASVGTLAAGVAHEINNPLTYVSSNLVYVGELLERMRGIHPEVEEAEKAVKEAVDGAWRVRNIVRDLRFVSRPPGDRRVEVDPVPEVRAALNLAQNEIRHRARLEVDLGTAPSVMAGEGQIGQVVLNLLVNASHSIPEGQLDRNRVRVATGEDERGWATVEVQDTGSGIPAAIRERIFEPFFTTKPVGRGTGLGLSIVHGIVTSLGGEIELQSEEGHGTTVRLRLPPASGPVAVASLPAEGAEPAATLAPPYRGRVLVIDDEPLVCRSVARVLGGDHEVESVHDPRQALDRLFSGQRYDLILCDVTMPHLSGLELVERLRERRPDAADRVVFVTGGPVTPETQDALDRCSTPRLAKPFEASALRELLRGRLAA
jgi:signal transduction histidine kinase